MRRLNLPKWTKTEYKKLHEEIASLALQLCELTTKVDTPIGTPADLWLLVALQERESC